MWLLNPTSEPMPVVAGELFGFGTGQYNNQVVLGILAFQFTAAVVHGLQLKEFCIDACLRQC